MGPPVSEDRDSVPPGIESISTEEPMATYILLSNTTDEGARTIKKNPGRIKEVNTELAKLGVKVVAQYATLGPYDFVNVVEASDNAAILRASAELSSRGSVKIITMPALDIDEFVRAIK